MAILSPNNRTQKIDWRRFKVRKRSVLLSKMLLESKMLLMPKTKVKKVIYKYLPAFYIDERLTFFCANFCSTNTSSCTWNWPNWLVGSWRWRYHFLVIKEFCYKWKIPYKKNITHKNLPFLKELPPFLFAVCWIYLISQMNE